MNKATVLLALIFATPLLQAETKKISCQVLNCKYVHAGKINSDSTCSLPSAKAKQILIASDEERTAPLTKKAQITTTEEGAYAIDATYYIDRDGNFIAWAEDGGDYRAFFPVNGQKGLVHEDTGGGPIGYRDMEVLCKVVPN